MKHQESTSIDPQDRLGEGWEPAPTPPITADGRGPAPPKYAPLPPEPPSLCRQGPCVNYFEIKHPLNASLPMDGTPAAIYRKTMRACFPGGGVEVELEDTPVFECSRWDPDQTRLVTLRITRSEYLKSEQGVAYTRELEAWEAARKRDADELQAALDSDDPPAPPPSVLVAMRAELAEGGEHDCLMLYKAGKFIRKIT